MPHSPRIHAGKIWLLNYKGLVVIVDADSGKIVNQIDMATKEHNYRDSGNHVRASIAVAHNQLYIRTQNKLFCISK